jgi:hypothetical protein
MVCMSDETENKPENEAPQAPSIDAPVSSAPEVVASQAAVPAVPSVAPAPPPVDERPIVVMKPRSQAWAAIAATLIVMTLAASGLAVYFLPSLRVAQEDAADAMASVGDAGATVYQDLKDGLKVAAETAKPKVETTTIIESALGELRAQGKLVVLTRNLSVRAEKSSKAVIWDSIPVDDSAVEIKVNNNRVQYVIPLHDLAARSFTYDEATNKLVVTVPEPRLDRELIAVSADPADWEVKKDIGWLHLQDYWPDWRGDRLESEARSQLRGLVIEAAEEPLVLKEAREQAYVMMTTLVKAAIAPFAPDLEIEVRLDAGLTPQEGTEAWPDSAPLS